MKIGGREINLNDVMLNSLRSAFVVDPRNPVRAWRAFGYARSMAPVPGTKEAVATLVHTNLPRSGDAGLPLDWEFRTFRWRAVAGAVLEPALVEWAAATSVQFAHQERIIGDAPLIDLLFGPQALDTFIKEKEEFRADIRTDDEAALGRFHDWLARDGSARTVTLWIIVEGHLQRMIV